MRCAIYARYSSDLQRESSLEDQIRRCREHAERRGWAVLDAYIRCDEAVSAAALHGRRALQSLVADAKGRPRPFDRILVEDTSRLARNIEDALRVIETLRFHGVHVHAVSQDIDSEDKTARQLLTLYGMMDEQYLVGLADKVHRGQEGRVLQGLHPGGKCFGYVNVPIEDPSRPAKYGRPAVSGVRLEMHPEEASIVGRIFQMYAGGASLAGIAKTLNAEGVTAPQPPRTRTTRAWGPSAIRALLRNERYRGIHIWNRTEKHRNPETGRKVSRRRPRADWVRVEVPEWRIVPEESWNAAHSRIALVNQRFGSARLGGFGRTAASKRYLFSGLLRCGACRSRMVIVSGRGRRGYVKYGCPSHRYRGVCDNALTIRQDRLEEQLLTALEQRVLQPEVLHYVFQRFRQELDRRMEELRRETSHSSPVKDLHQERLRLGAQAQRIAEAIAQTGHSPTLLTHLASIESQLARVHQRIEAHQPVEVDPTMEEIREFVSKNLMQLRAVLCDDPNMTRAALSKHISQLVLTPRKMPSGPVFEVSGSFDVLGDKDVMPASEA
jgi:site-specific DNA recombinase